ncbi:hypothetical protein SCLCIDRAFT_23539 [Scleroderma citrinum Foug A]|uniref:Uncharacterized protein n=1 Tax=Scleroderma citrinum Foug A TaxID=1036808 RepID=A0A0C3E7Y7_9AGAM|nr:hypothetical protein SCLCIDRAFT_23539 [Scleroderma citrinum Foug A]
MLSCRLLAAALALEYLAAIATNGDQLAVMHFLLIILMLWLMDSFTSTPLLS